MSVSPIRISIKEVVAYEIMVYNQDVEEPIEHKEKDIYAANTVKDFFMELDQTHFLGNKDAYLTFTPSLLIKEIPCIFSKDKLIIQVEDSAIVNPLSQKTLYHYKELGYRMALVDFEFSPRFLGIIDIIDIIKLDFSNPDQSSLSNVVSIARKFNKKIVAYNVNTRHAYDKARELAVDYIQGESVADVLRSTVHRMDHLKSNFFQLVVAVNREEPDVAEISSIISKDVTLSFRLMKLVNSAYFSLKNKVTSLSQAITVLGWHSSSSGFTCSALARKTMGFPKSSSGSRSCAAICARYWPNPARISRLPIPRHICSVCSPPWAP